TAPGAVGAGGFYRIVNLDSPYYPRRRFIVNITQAAQAVITFSQTHGFTAGQQIRLIVPAQYGMVQMDNQLATVTAVSTANNTVTVNIDSSAFTAFAFPQPGVVPFTQAQAVPVGEDTGFAVTNNLNILADATVNTSIIVMILSGGAGFPGGDANDVIFWQAGKGFSNRV